MSKFKFLRKRSDYYRHFTVLDIGTDLVKVLVVRRDGPDGEILGVGREPQAPAAMSGGAIADLEQVIQSCNRALEAAEDMAKTVPGQVVVGIAGELIKGFSSTIAYRVTVPRPTSSSSTRAATPRRRWRRSSVYEPARRARGSSRSPCSRIPI